MYSILDEGYLITIRCNNKTSFFLSDKKKQETDTWNETNH